MPHIIVHGCNLDCTTQYITLDAKINFRNDYFKTIHADIKMDELENKMIALLEEYFPGKVVVETLSNHEYNITQHGSY